MPASGHQADWGKSTQGFWLLHAMLSTPCWLLPPALSAWQCTIAASDHLSRTLLPATYCQPGIQDYLTFIRSLEVLECPVFAITVLIIHQYVIKRTTIPDISTKEGTHAM